MTHTDKKLPRTWVFPVLALLIVAVEYLLDFLDAGIFDIVGEYFGYRTLVGAILVASSLLVSFSIRHTYSNPMRADENRKKREEEDRLLRLLEQERIQLLNHLAPDEKRLLNRYFRKGTKSLQLPPTGVDSVRSLEANGILFVSHQRTGREKGKGEVQYGIAEWAWKLLDLNPQWLKQPTEE